MTQNDTAESVLTGRQLKALDALISCDTITEACEVSGISRSTMFRYQQDPEFSKELKAAKRQLVNRAILRLQQACGDASRTLAEICRDKDAPTSAWVSASREILNNSLRAIEVEDIEERLAELEQRLLKG